MLQFEKPRGTHGARKTVFINSEYGRGSVETVEGSTHDPRTGSHRRQFAMFEFDDPDLLGDVYLEDEDSEPEWIDDFHSEPVRNIAPRIPGAVEQAMHQARLQIVYEEYLKSPLAQRVMGKLAEITTDQD